MNKAFTYAERMKISGNNYNVLSRAWHQQFTTSFVRCHLNGIMTLFLFFFFLMMNQWIQLYFLIYYCVSFSFCTLVVKLKLLFVLQWNSHKRCWAEMKMFSYTKQNSVHERTHTCINKYNLNEGLKALCLPSIFFSIIYSSTLLFKLSHLLIAINRLAATCIYSFIWFISIVCKYKMVQQDNVCHICYLKYRLRVKWENIYC